MELSLRACKVRESSTLAISARAKALKQSGVDIISFTAGEPDFNTPEHINNAAVKAMQEGFTKYTQVSGIEELKKAICKKLKDDNSLDYEPSQIIVSTGAKQCIFNTFCAILNDGDEVLIPAPHWNSYCEIIKLCGGVPVTIYTKPENGMKIVKSQLEEALTSKTKAIIINTPTNPTGIVYTKEELQMIADFACKNDIFVLSDEIYEKLIYNESMPHVSIASLNEDIYKRTIVINGFSKTYSMTGWRVGYSACSKELAEIFNNLQSHITANVNSIAQKAALSALTESQQCVEDMKQEFKRRKDYMFKRVSNISWFDPVEPHGAFYIFVDISKLCGKQINGKEITDGNTYSEILLSECNVAVVPAIDFGYPKCIRFSFSTSMDNIEKGLDRIEKALSKMNLS